MEKKPAQRRAKPKSQPNVSSDAKRTAIAIGSILAGIFGGYYTGKASHHFREQEMISHFSESHFLERPGPEFNPNIADERMRMFKANLADGERLIWEQLPKFPYLVEEAWFVDLNQGKWYEVGKNKQGAIGVGLDYYRIGILSEIIVKEPRFLGLYHTHFEYSHEKPGSFIRLRRQQIQRREKQLSVEKNERKKRILNKRIKEAQKQIELTRAYGEEFIGFLYSFGGMFPSENDIRTSFHFFRDYGMNTFGVVGKHGVIKYEFLAGAELEEIVNPIFINPYIDFGSEAFLRTKESENLTMHQKIQMGVSYANELFKGNLKLTFIPL